MRELKLLGYRVLVGKDYEEMSQITAYYMISKMAEKRRMNIAITSGNTPKRIYEIMIPMVKDNFQNVHYFNFDEIPNPHTEYDMTIGALRNDFLTPAGIEEKRIHPLTVDNYATHDQMIANLGGLDVMMLGLGENGHFCGNNPNVTKLNDWTVCLPLTRRQLEWISTSSCFEPLYTFPCPYYVTMGPRSVLHTKEIVLIVNGKHKAEILKRILTEDVSMDCPSTVFQLHPNVTLIIDEDAASQLE